MKRSMHFKGLLKGLLKGVLKGLLQCPFMQRSPTPKPIAEAAPRPEQSVRQPVRTTIAHGAVFQGPEKSEGSRSVFVAKLFFGGLG